MSFHRLCFNLIRLLFLAKPAMENNKISELWPDLWRHRWPSDKLLQLFREFKPEAIKWRFWIESSSLADSKGAETPHPHRRVGSGNTPLGRGLILGSPDVIKHWFFWNFDFKFPHWKGTWCPRFWVIEEVHTQANNGWLNNLLEFTKCP